jgi:hypothetical protein
MNEGSVPLLKMMREIDAIAARVYVDTRISLRTLRPPAQP